MKLHNRYWYFVIFEGEHKCNIHKTLSKDKAYEIACKQSVYIEPSKRLFEVRQAIAPILTERRDSLAQSLNNVNRTHARYIPSID